MGDLCDELSKSLAEPRRTRSSAPGEQSNISAGSRWPLVGQRGKPNHLLERTRLRSVMAHTIMRPVNRATSDSTLP
jgi:hypothetical protein